jgi:two-component system KDP operon response regulator KdpE
MQGSEPLILLIEDEAPMRKFLRAALSAEGFRVHEADTGQQGIRLATQQPPDIVLLDLGLPDMDGQEVLRQLREWLPAPIIVLSARDQERQKIAALDQGADDYLTKPFAIGELFARLRVAMRHAARGDSGPIDKVYQVAHLKVDLAFRRVFVNDQEVRLTPTEYRLLTTLIRHAGKVVTHRQLLMEVWGPDCVQETHYLRVFMAQLRQKIEMDSAQPRYLLTEPGVGYRLVAE